MFPVSFYSYKGGVGRTQALVNVAFRLAELGKRVFVLDFDLEAPGVDSFTTLGLDKPTPGIIEYISEYTSSGKVPDLARFVHRVGQLEARGVVYVMPAGKKDRNYKVQLSKLDWKHFYGKKKGFLFVENLKASIAKHYSADYLLIDSRTGLTDTSGICTLQLPNLVIFVFSLNNQNIGGTAEILESVRANRVNKLIETLLVASPVPDIPDDISIKRIRLEAVRDRLGSAPDISLPYDPLVALEEAVIQSKGSGLSRQYDQLTNLIIAKNPQDVLTVLRKARTLRDNGEFDLAEMHFQQAIELAPNDLDLLLEVGNFHRFRRDWNAALDTYEKAKLLSDPAKRAIAQIAVTHSQMGKLDLTMQDTENFLRESTDVEEIKKLAAYFVNARHQELALSTYGKALHLKPSVDIHLEVGNLYMHFSRYKEAVIEYEMGLKYDKDHLPCTYNLGMALFRSKSERSRQYLDRAIHLYQQRDWSSTSSQTQANTMQAIGQALCVLGMHSEGVRNFEKAMDIAKKFPRVLYYSSVKYELISARVFHDETEQLKRACMERQRVF